MNRELFEKIFEETKSEWEGDNCYQGLQIIAKYTKNTIQGAGHDIVHSEDVEKLIESGITEEDVRSLARLNWIIEDYGHIACFV